MNIQIPPPDGFLDLEGSGHLLKMVESLFDSGQPGVLSTIDRNGFPQSRWMATTSFATFPHFYTLTSPDSQKVQQIAVHPMVSWMFSTPDLSLVVNLLCRAHVLLEDAETMKRIWRHINDKSRAYFLGNSTTGPGFAVIETVVELVECTLPENNQKFLIDPAQLHPGRRAAAACSGCCGQCEKAPAV